MVDSLVFVEEDRFDPTLDSRLFSKDDEAFDYEKFADDSYRENLPPNAESGLKQLSVVALALDR